MNIGLWKGCDNIILWGVERALSYNLLDDLQHQNIYALVPSNELKHALKKKLEEQSFDATLKIEQAYLNDKAVEATLREFSLPQMNSLNVPSGIFDIYPGLKQLQMQSVQCLSPNSLLAAYKLSDQAENTLWLEVNGQITSTITAIIESEEIYLFSKLFIFMPDNAWYESEINAEELIQRLKHGGYDVSSKNVDLDSDQYLYEFVRHPLVLEKKTLESEIKSLKQSQYQKKSLKKRLEEEVGELAEKDLTQNQKSVIIQKLIGDFKAQQKEFSQKLEKMQSEKSGLNNKLICQIVNLTALLSEKFTLILGSEAKLAQFKEGFVQLSEAIEGLTAENEQINKANISTYFIDPNYVSRTEYHHYDDLECKDQWQLEVYLRASGLMMKHNFKTVADFGCGSGYKLLTYFKGFHTIGYELPENVEILKERHPDKDWRISDFESDELLDVDVLICSDVIEHLVDPNILLNYFLRQKFKYLVLSTPDRELVYKKGSPDLNGPPRNMAHVREWTFLEFNRYIKDFFFSNRACCFK